MVIEELLVHNFGVFRGEQRISLAPPSKDQPVVLFGGLNGTGKTTLLEAMQFVLYGKSSANSRRSELTYEEYLRRLIHRQVNPKEGAAVEVLLRVNEDGRSRLIRVRRTWSANASRVCEKLEVFRDGQLDEHLTDTWLDYVGRLMPPQLSELFFFDGERIESLADPAQSLDILRSAVHALLGIDLIKQLQADLIVLNRRKMVERRPGPERTRLETAESTVQGLRSKLFDLKQSRAQHQVETDYAIKRVLELNGKFAREGGLLAADRTALEQRHADLAREKNSTEIQLRALASSSLPLGMLRSMLADIRRHALLETDAQEAIVARTLAEKRDRRLIKRLRSEFTDPDVLRRFEKLLSADREAHLKPRECDIYLKLDSDTRHRLSELCDLDIDTISTDCEAVIDRCDQLKQMLDDADQKLAAIPDAEAIARLMSEREKAISRRTELESQLQQVDSELAALSRETEAQEKELARLNEEARQADLGNEEFDRFTRHTERAQEVLERFRIVLANKHAERLGRNILTAFGRLLRKQQLIHGLTIDPGTCRLALTDMEGVELPTERLSAGERQLLAVSILWGLGQAAGRSLPVIVDTPLGRLDTKHRMHLVERYFPFASHQVILLSTDEEITDEYLEALRPKIGRSYRLVHDDVLRSTNIEEGYFERQEAPC